MKPRSGYEEAVPYSLSRWTDVPGAKWGWMKATLQEGRMQAFDQRTGVPSWWSLDPKDTHSLVFWTKNPKNLVVDYDMLAPYRVRAHVTITGWTEVEHGVPNYSVVTSWTRSLSNIIGKENVTWRFSPVPMLPFLEVLTRFERIARRMSGVTEKVLVSFLQENDDMPETRTPTEQKILASEMAQIAREYGITVEVCRAEATGMIPDEMRGTCVPCETVNGTPKAEKCGCAFMVDPFTINETCTYGCEYCYAADKSLAPKKRNTTRALPVIR